MVVHLLAPSMPHRRRGNQKIYKSSQPPLQHRVADKGPGCSWQRVYREIERLPLKHGDPAAALADCCLTVLLLSGGMSLRAAAGHFEAPEPEGSMPRTRHRKCSGITDLRYVRSERNCPPPPHPSRKHGRKHHGVIHTVGQLLGVGVISHPLVRIHINVGRGWFWETTHQRGAS